MLLLVGCSGEKVERIRIVNNTGLEMARVTIGSLSSPAERATFTNVSPGGQTEYVIVTNFVYPCSVWTLDSTNYQRNAKIIHSPEEKVLPKGDYTFVIALDGPTVTLKRER